MRPTRPAADSDQATPPRVADLALLLRVLRNRPELREALAPRRAVRA